MKKRAILSAIVLSAALLGNTPVVSQAAEMKAAKVQGTGCYQFLTGQGTESLKQILKELGITIGNPGDSFPDTEQPAVPDTENPDVNAPTNPAPETPDFSDTNDTETPDEQESETEETTSAAFSYAEQVVKLVNKERAKAGLPALELQTDITAAANIRAKEIKQKFSHTRPNGNSFSSVLKEQGVSFRGAGENIAYGQKTPEQVMEGWMNSDGHRANILNQNFKNIGVGYYQDERGVNHWVQLFTY